jgi:hypothetical protein
MGSEPPMRQRKHQQKREILAEIAEELCSFRHTQFTLPENPPLKIVISAPLSLPGPQIGMTTIEIFRDCCCYSLSKIPEY